MVGEPAILICIPECWFTLYLRYDAVVAHFLAGTHLSLDGISLKSFSRKFIREILKNIRFAMFRGILKNDKKKKKKKK